MKVVAWLLKSEPDTFGIDVLAAAPEKSTIWDGVRNYQARNNLMAMQKGDRAFFYHSSCAVPAIVGEMQVTETAKPDASQFDQQSPYFDAKSTPEKPRWFAPRLKFVRKYAAIFSRDEMAQTAISKSQLFTHTRLSVIPLSAADVRVIDAWIKKVKA